MHKILLVIFIFVNAIPVFAYNSIYRAPLHNYRNYRQQYNPSYNLNRQLNNKMRTLERYAFNRTYNNENEISRLERLENMAFGSIQSGDINTRYKNVENAILARGQNVYKRNLLNTLSNYFTGQTTGITPNIIPYSSSFYPNYNNTYTNQYSNGFFNNRYTNFGNTYGSGSSIRILD